MSLIQKTIDKAVLKDFKDKANNIDKITEWALAKENRRISDKYSNIENTVKILKNLMLEFGKKADRLEKSMFGTARIAEIEFQNSYYQKRIVECVGLSEKLKSEIEEKKNKIAHREQQVNQLKRTLVRLKTDNIKLVMKMEELESTLHEKSSKENTKEKRLEYKQKLKEDHQQLTFKSFNNGYETLQMENQQLQAQLFDKIDRVNMLRQFVNKCFEIMKLKLRNMEKKSNQYGLAGSLFFKLSSKEETLLPTFQKKHDAKLMIYDVLKQKYDKFRRDERKKEEQFSVTLEQFMKFNPLQIVGVIELKGGFSKIKNKLSINFQSCQPQKEYAKSMSPFSENPSKTEENS